MPKIARLTITIDGSGYIVSTHKFVAGGKRALAERYKVSSRSALGDAAGRERMLLALTQPTRTRVA